MSLLEAQLRAALLTRATRRESKTCKDQRQQSGSGAADAARSSLEGFGRGSIVGSRARAFPASVLDLQAAPAPSPFPTWQGKGEGLIPTKQRY